MGFKVKLVLEYPYEGEATDSETIASEERQAMVDGEVTIEDILTAGDCKMQVTVTENADIED